MISSGHRTATRTNVRPALRRAARTMAAVYALTMVLSTLHFATTQHRICPEHGEILDVGSRAQHRHAAPVVAQAVPRSGAVRRDNDGTPAFEHEVCLVEAVDRASRLATWAVAVSPPPPLTALAPRRTGAHTPLGRPAVHHFAPKTSPPTPPVA